MKILEIRPATVADAKELLKIYAPYVIDTTITFEYVVPTEIEFASRIKSTLKKYPYLVAENDGKIVGYAYAHPYGERAAYAWTAEASIYVEQNTRGLGVGKALYHALEDELKRQNIVNVCVCITGKNSDSVAFHEKIGYRHIGTFEHFGYKFGQWYNVIWMQKEIGDVTDPVDFIPYNYLK